MTAAFFACLATGREPSVRNVAGMVRSIAGKGSRIADVAAFLRSNGKRLGNAWETLPETPRETASVLKMADRETPRETAPETNGKRPGNDTRGARPRAEVFIPRDLPTANSLDTPSLRSGVSSSAESGQTPLPLDDRSRPADPKASPLNLAAFAIRDRLARLVAPHLQGMTLKTWQQRNSNTARDMADAGVTAEEAADFWRVRFERTGRPYIVLKFLHDDLVAERMRQGGRPPRNGDPNAGMVRRERSETDAAIEASQAAKRQRVIAAAAIQPPPRNDKETPRP